MKLPWILLYFLESKGSAGSSQRAWEREVGAAGKAVSTAEQGRSALNRNGLACILRDTILA